MNGVGASLRLTDSQRKVEAVLVRILKDVLPIMNDDVCLGLLTDMRNHVNQALSHPQEAPDYASQTLQELLALGESEEEVEATKKRGRPGKKKKEEKVLTEWDVQEYPYVESFEGFADTSNKEVRFKVKRSVNSGFPHTVQMSIDKLNHTMTSGTRSSFVQVMKDYFGNDHKKIPDEMKKLF
jgi:hypothetical protein